MNDPGLPEGGEELLAEARKNNEYAERASGTGYGECSKESLLEDSGADVERMEAEMRAKNAEWAPIMEKIKEKQAARPLSNYDDFPEYIALGKDQRKWMRKWMLEAHGLGQGGTKLSEVTREKDGLHQDRMLTFGLLPIEDELTLRERKRTKGMEENHEEDDEDVYDPYAEYEDPWDFEGGHEYDD